MNHSKKAASARPRKLVYLTLEAPREGSAGYAHVHEIIKGLKKRGWKVNLYKPYYARKDTSPPLWQRLFVMLWLQMRLWLGWQRGNVLYIRSHFIAFPSSVLAWIFGIPVIHEVNGPYEDVYISHPQLRRFRRILIWMQKWQYRHATGLIAVTRDLESWAARESKGRPTAFISNGADTDLFRPGYVRPEGLPEKYVIFFGGLARWHGVETMLASIQDSNWPADLSLVVVGEGQESPAVNEAARNNKRIMAPGKKPYTELPAYICHAMASLVPISDPDKRSSTGIMPLKLFESLACGIPVIATDLPGQADFIKTYGCGLLIPLDDPAALAKAVKQLYENPNTAQAMGKKGRAAIKAEHSWDIRAEATHQKLLTWLGP